MYLILSMVLGTTFASKKVVWWALATMLAQASTFALWWGLVPVLASLLVTSVRSLALRWFFLTACPKRRQAALGSRHIDGQSLRAGRGR